MAGLVTPPGFGKNSWGEDTWAAAMAANLPAFRVSGPNAWKPSIAAGLDRGIALAPGGGWAYGVWDRTDTTDTVQCNANTGTTDRYDLIVSRWTWATGKRVFAVLQGTSSPPAINTTGLIDSAKVNRIPGSRYEAIIGVVRVRPGVGTIAANDLTDLRVWGGTAGPLIRPTEAYLNLIDSDLGSQVLCLNTNRTWNRRAASWVPDDHVYAYLRQATPQPVGPGGPAALKFQATSYDSHNGHDPASSTPSRWYAPYAGIYEVSGECPIEGSSVTARRWLKLNINGNFADDTNGPFVDAAPGKLVTAVMLPRLVTLGAGQWVELMANQDGPVDVRTACYTDTRSIMQVKSFLFF